MEDALPILFHQALELLVHAVGAALGARLEAGAFAKRCDELNSIAGALARSLLGTFPAGSTSSARCSSRSRPDS